MSLSSFLRDVITHPITEDVASLVPGVSTAVKVNELVRKSKKGDRDAQARLAAIKKLANQGDTKAQLVVEQAKLASAQTPAKKSYYDIGVTVGHDPYEFVGATIREHGASTAPAPGQPGSGFRYEGRRLVPCDPRTRALLASQKGQYVPGTRVIDKRTIKVQPGQSQYDALRAQQAKAAAWAQNAAARPNRPEILPGFGAQYDSQGNYLGTTDPSTRGQITVDEGTGQAYDPGSGVTFNPETGDVIRQPGGSPTPPGLPPGFDPTNPYGQVDPFTGMPYPGGMPYPQGLPPGFDPYGGYGANPYGLAPGYGAPQGPQGVYDPYDLLAYLSQLGVSDGTPVCAPRRRVYDPDTDRFYADDVKMTYDADTNSFNPVSCYNPYAALDEAYGHNPYGPQVSGWTYNQPYRTNSEALIQRTPGIGAGAREMYNRGLGQAPTSTDTVARTALANRPTALAAYGLAKRLL